MTFGRWGGFAKALLAAYVLASALLPFSHHDVICHLKSTTHCTTCIATSSGETASGTTGLGAAALHDAGQAAPAIITCVHSASVSASSGRSPPYFG